MKKSSLNILPSPISALTLFAGAVAFSVTLGMAQEPPPTPKNTAPKAAEESPKKPMVKDERPKGGDGSMFFKVFVSRNDKNGDGMIEKSEFRGGGDRFDTMDKNKNGKLDRAEIDELHRKRVADPLSMRQRIERGETRRPPVDLPVEPGQNPKADGDAGEKKAPTVLTPLGTRITARQAFARLDVDQDKKVTAREFQRSPGMSDEEKAKQIVKRVDRNGDGSLSFEEFNEVFAKRHAKQQDNRQPSKPAQPSRK